MPALPGTDIEGPTASIVRTRGRLMCRALAVLASAMLLMLLAVSLAQAQSRTHARFPAIDAAQSDARTTGASSRRPRLGNPEILRHLRRGCTLRQMKSGLCGRRAGGTSGARSSQTDRATGPVCINGRRSGQTCVCPAGGTPRRVGRNVYKCATAAERCPKGYVRVGRRCIKFVPPPPRPEAHCIGGRSVEGRCICRAPARPVRIAGRGFRCVAEACPQGTRRIGRRCLALPDPDRPSSEPPKHCHSGTIARGGRCIRRIKLPCPAGSYRSGAVCVRTPTTEQPPTRHRPRRPSDLVPPGLPRPPGTAAVPPRPTPAPAAAAAQASDDFEPNEVLVEISGPAPQTIANRLVQQFRLVTLSQTQLTLLGVSLYRFRVPANSTVQETVAALTQQQGVSSAQPNFLYRLNRDATAATGPPAAATTSGLPQYAIDLIELKKAHAINRGGNVLVAIIDTGIDDKHPEIEGAVAAHFNAFAGQPHMPRTHGTAIAGIITAHRELQGIAPEARILAVQAFGAESTDGAGSGNSYRVASGLNWALLKGARVINMSFAGRSPDALLSRLIDKGGQAGAILIAAAGNGGPDAKPAFPASHEAVIAVTAIDDARKLYPHANVGAYIDLAAPGVDVMAPTIGNGYDLASGTSFAAAHASGLAALMLAAEPTLKREALLARLKATAMDLGPPGPDHEFGAGCINALRALADHNTVVGGPR